MLLLIYFINLITYTYINSCFGVFWLYIICNRQTIWLSLMGLHCVRTMYLYKCRCFCFYRNLIDFLYFVILCQEFYHNNNNFMTCSTLQQGINVLISHSCWVAYCLHHVHSSKQIIRSRLISWPFLTNVSILKWPCLDARHQAQKSTMCYKIINGRSCIPPNTFSQHPYPSLRHCHTFPCLFRRLIQYLIDPPFFVSVVPLSALWEWFEAFYRLGHFLLKIFIN